MYPVLVVEGVAHTVITVNFRDKQPTDVYVNENGEYVVYYDKKHGLYAGGAKTIDLSKSLKWMNQHDLLAKELLNRVESKEEILMSLENQLMIIAKQKKKLPFNDGESEKIIDHHNRLESELNGMYEAIGIMSEMCMQEDIDLSGGEEIAEPSTD